MKPAYVEFESMTAALRSRADWRRRKLISFVVSAIWLTALTAWYSGLRVSAAWIEDGITISVRLSAPAPDRTTSHPPALP